MSLACKAAGQRLAVALLAALAATPSPARAVEWLSVTVDRVEPADGEHRWAGALEAVSVELQLANELTLEASAQLRGAARRLLGDALRVRCAEGAGCGEGQLAVRVAQEWRESTWRVSPAPDNDAGWRLVTEPLRARDLSVVASGRGEPAGWRAVVDLDAIRARRLAAVLKPVLPDDVDVQAGALRGTLELARSATAPAGAAGGVAVGGSVRFSGLEFSNAAGTLAAEDLTGAIGVSRSASGWTQVSLGIPRGVAWFDPLLLDAGEGRLSVRATVSPGGTRVSKVSLAHEGQLRVRGCRKTGARWRGPPAGRAGAVAAGAAGRSGVGALPRAGTGTGSSGRHDRGGAAVGTGRLAARRRRLREREWLVGNAATARRALRAQRGPDRTERSGRQLALARGR